MATKSTKLSKKTPTDVETPPTLHGRRGILGAIGLLLLAGLLSQTVWRSVKPTLRTDSRYQVTADSISLSEQPAWIHADVKLEALSRSGLIATPTGASLTGSNLPGAPPGANPGMKQPLSILDAPNQLEERLATALEFHPWIRSVGKITKSSPNRLQVQVEYRKPIAALDTGLNNASHHRFVPIDNEGILLPAANLAKQELGFLPRIDIHNLRHTTAANSFRPGERWTDPRIIGALSIIEQLGQQWHQLALLSVTPSKTPEVLGTQRFYVYELCSNGGTRIAWGAAPNPQLAPSNEAPFEAKLTRLQTYIAQNGPLNSVEGSPEWIDIRTNIQVRQRMVKLEESADKKTRTAMAQKKSSTSDENATTTK